MTDPSPTPVNALLPGRVGLFVRLISRDGARPAVLDVLHRYVDRLDAEPDTEAFIISLDPEDHNIVWLYEWFRDDEALAAHRDADAFAAMMTEMPTLLGAPPALLRVDPLRLHLQRRVLEETSLDLL